MHDTMKRHVAYKIDLPEAPWVIWLYRGIVLTPDWEPNPEHPGSVEFLFQTEVYGADNLEEAGVLIDQLIADEADED